MANGAGWRWTVLLSALGATCAAIIYPAPDQFETVELADRSEPRGERRAPRPLVAMTREEVGARDAWEPLLADPFAPRQWQAPVVAVAAPVVATVVVAPEAPAAPAGPPALPYQFVGQMNDGADLVVYLARGEQALLARSGEVLESTYKVLQISPAQVEFEHLPTGQKQALLIPAQSN